MNCRLGRKHVPFLWLRLQALLSDSEAIRAELKTIEEGPTVGTVKGGRVDHRACTCLLDMQALPSR